MIIISSIKERLEETSTDDVILSTPPPIHRSLKFVHGRSTTKPNQPQYKLEDWIHSISVVPQKKNQIILCRSEKDDELKVKFSIGPVKSLLIKKEDVYNKATLEELTENIKGYIDLCYSDIDVQNFTLIKKEPQSNPFAAAIQTTPAYTSSA